MCGNLAFFVLALCQAVLHGVHTDAQQLLGLGEVAELGSVLGFTMSQLESGILHLCVKMKLAVSGIHADQLQAADDADSAETS